MLLIYWAEAYIIYIKTDPLDVVSKEIGLEINDNGTKYMLCLEIRMQDDVKI